MKQIVGYIGTSAANTVSTYFELIRLFYDMITRLLFNPETRIDKSQLINQILFTGVDALGTITLIAAAVGTTLSMQLINNFANIDITSLFGSIMILLLKELSPFVTAMVIVGRSGSAFTTFLGNMQVTREVDVLTSMSISVIDYLCIPNFIGLTIAMVGLNFYFSAVTIIGGLTMTHVLTQLPFSILISQIITQMHFVDVLLIILKCITFGAVIATTSSYFGLAVKSIRIVPRAVFRTVVSSIVFILLSNIALTLMSSFFLEQRY
ncbi:MAG: MlaE family ABC transporter permease [Fibrobacterota bacterium]